MMMFVFLFPDMAGIVPGNSTSWWSSLLFMLIGKPAAPPPQSVMNQPPGTYGISFSKRFSTRFMTDDLPNGWALSSTSTFMNYHDINKFNPLSRSYIRTDQRPIAKEWFYTHPRLRISMRRHNSHICVECYMCFAHYRPSGSFPIGFEIDTNIRNSSRHDRNQRSGTSSWWAVRAVFICPNRSYAGKPYSGRYCQ